MEVPADVVIPADTLHVIEKNRKLLVVRISA
jgi:hypothetical protein